MNDEPLKEPESQKPTSQSFYNKSVSASTIEHNDQLDRTSQTPFKQPSGDTPYVLNNNTLNPISNDIIPTETSTGAINIPSPSPDSDNTYINPRARIKASLPPLDRIKNNTPATTKKRLPLILIICSLFILLIVISTLVYCTNIDSFRSISNTINLSITKTQTLYVIYIIFGMCVSTLAITIILAYRGENNSFLLGLKKMLIFMLFLCIILAGVSSVTNSKNGVSILSLVPLTISCLIYFTSYFILKRIVWFIMHKTNYRSKIIFAIIYSLVYFIVTAITIKIRL